MRLHDRVHGHYSQLEQNNNICACMDLLTFSDSRIQKHTVQWMIAAIN